MYVKLYISCMYVFMCVHVYVLVFFSRAVKVLLKKMMNCNNEAVFVAKRLYWFYLHNYFIYKIHSWLIIHDYNFM